MEYIVLETAIVLFVESGEGDTSGSSESPFTIEMVSFMQFVVFRNGLCL
jgi:hypothetical protein